VVGAAPRQQAVALQVHTDNFVHCKTYTLDDFVVIVRLLVFTMPITSNMLNMTHFQRPIDIVIATPVRALQVAVLYYTSTILLPYFRSFGSMAHPVLQLMESRNLHLSAVRQVVLDEVTSAVLIQTVLMILLTGPLMQVDTLFDASFKADTQALHTHL
jgi:superfamily II DNA/RNA helicase